MPCAYACKSPFGAYRQAPCRECQAEYDRFMDESYEHYRRKAAVKNFRAWLRSLAADWETPDQAARDNHLLSICFDQTSLTRTPTHETL